MGRSPTPFVIVGLGAWLVVTLLRGQKRPGVLPVPTPGPTPDPTPLPPQDPSGDLDELPPRTPPEPSGQVYLTGEAREARFGPPGSNLQTVRVPQLENTNSPFVTLNREALPSFLAVMADVERLGLLPLLKQNSGSFNDRDVRGRPGLKSAHAYGTAIDLNAGENPLGTLGTPDQFQLAHVFARRGWYWGGWFPTRPDPMQFEFLGDGSEIPNV